MKAESDTQNYDEHLLESILKHIESTVKDGWSVDIQEIRF